MVLSDIGENRHIRSEIHCVIELEAADLCYIPGLACFRYLTCERVADISYQRAIQSSMPADMINHCRGGRLAIAPCYANDLAIAFIPIGQLYFADDGNTFFS